MAYPEWADKPFNFGDFRAGQSSSTHSSTEPCSPRHRRRRAPSTTSPTRCGSRRDRAGMYDMNAETPTRTASTGFVLPSNDEWVKAAYYDPKHGGTDSYWAYPTGPFNPPNVVRVESRHRRRRQTRACSHWRPTTRTTRTAASTLPVRRPERPRRGVRRRPGPTATNSPPISRRELDLQKVYMGNVSTVGQAKTPSPWGTYDQGATSSRSSTRSRRSRRDTTSCGTGATTTAVWPTRPPTSSRSRHSATSPATRNSEGSPWMGFRVAVIEKLKVVQRTVSRTHSPVGHAS